jgi:AcrR family transcriptional regulator
MSLFEEHKAERRERILKAARKLVAERGYDGLTMRDLARAARVSVPTLYNLFGSKDAILIAELEHSARTIAARMPVGGASFFQRGRAGFETGTRLIEESPELYRAAMRMFLTSPELAPMRQRVEDGFIAIMAGNLGAAKAAGQLAEWAQPMIVARHLFAGYVAAFLSWGIGELELPQFRAAALSSMCHLLIGCARGEFAREVEAELQRLASEPALQTFKEARHGIARD